jgi:RimJ/RimL family protein N-acetyltransferase
MYHGRLVILQALESSDVDEILEYYNDWSVRRWTGVPLPRSRRDIEEWLEKVTKSDPWRDGTLYFAVTDKKTGQFLGIARLYDIRSPHLRASIGVSIHDTENRSKGYGTDATQVVLWVGFHVLGLHSIYLDTMEDNERAIHVAEKAGFKRIGIFRETEFIRGEYKGLLYMDILREEFMEKYPPGTKIDATNGV